MAILTMSHLQTKAQQLSRDEYPDVLNIRYQVKDTANVTTGCFSDQGAWHAYALPAQDKEQAAFVGPMLMDMQGRWLGNTTARLQVFEKGKELPLAAGETHYYPGLLAQSWQLPGLLLKMKLLFSNDHTAVIQTQLINTGRQKRTVQLQWSGDILLQTSATQTANSLLLTVHKGGHQFRIDYDNPGWKIAVSNTGYNAARTVAIPGHATTTYTQQQSYHPDSSKVKTKRPSPSFASLLQANQLRWNNYLQQGLSGVAKDKQPLGVKCIITLLTNWRSAARGLRHDGVFPSVSYQGFYGFWAWDSWKQAVALTRFHPQLAKDNIRAMFDYQNAAGMVPDCIYTDTTENNWRDTKPPLAAWAVLAVYTKTKDTAFVQEMYPLLEKYHHWWYQDRDHDRDSLCEFGATDGTRIAAAWESGMDNAVRFDNARMLRNGLNAWSLDQSSVDLNVYLYAEKKYLAALAAILQRTQIAARWNQQAATLNSRINDRYYDGTTGFYYDRRLPGDTLVKVLGAEGWLPLWAGLADSTQAAAVTKTLLLPETFNTTVPFPVLSAAHPAFDPRRGYWRGPVWLDQFYFGIRGLRRYGFRNAADALLNKLWNNAQGMQDNLPLFENYHPLSGKGLNAHNFSWSAAHVLLMLDNTAIQTDQSVE